MKLWPTPQQTDCKADQPRRRQGVGGPGPTVAVPLSSLLGGISGEKMSSS